MGLFRSNGGLELLPEVSLQIVGVVLNSDPKAAGRLLSLSKEFYSLLSTYEISVAKTVLDTSKHKFAFTNASQAEVLSSRIPPGDILVSRLSYPWISEMQCRSDVINFLLEHEITEMLDSTNSWPTLDRPKNELSKRLTMFKKRALSLLYKLVDCATGVTATHAIRAHQSEFLDSLSSEELASLGTMVEVMGQGFFTVTKRALHASGLLSNIPIRPSSASHLYTPASTPMEDLHNDNWIRECMCVFEDLIQRYGPYYAYAYFEGSNSSRRGDLWARSLLQNGLDNMNAYEMGYTMAYASLQSVVWRVFCRKVDCNLQNSWQVAKEMIERQMENYQV
ncbi:putative integral membrane protein duf125 [Diplocarpon rosae]|nr:putative integral membrane protein duf125 [Diplocarpon rosae]